MTGDTYSLEYKWVPKATKQEHLIDLDRVHQSLLSNRATPHHNLHRRYRAKIRTPICLYISPLTHTWNHSHTQKGTRVTHADSLKHDRLRDAHTFNPLDNMLA